MVDGIEVINSENIHKWNLKCALLGYNLEKSIVGGSDGHSIDQIGQVVSYSKCNNNPKAFLDAIKLKQNKVIGNEINIIRKLRSNSMKLKNNIINYPNLFEKNIKYSYSFINSKSKRLINNFKTKLKKIRVRSQNKRNIN